MIKQFYSYLFFFVIFLPAIVCSQGRSNNWQLGYATLLTPPYDSSLRGNISFPGNTISIQGLNRKMKFDATEANISDKNGNLLFVSNGIWIANALGDSMLNGTRLNPGPIASQFYNYGMGMANANIIIPYPNDSLKYILFHSVPNPSAALEATELFYTVIDMTLDGGLGGVTLKNQIAFQDTLTWAISACKHANGRDWWIVMLKNGSDKIYKLLVTPSGIQSVTSQAVGGIINYAGSVCQSTFSNDGKKFAYTSAYINGSQNYTTDTRLLDFDRCSGTFSNYRNYSLSNYYAGYGVAFSPNSKYLYTCTVHNIFQINADSSSLIIDTVATNDVFYSPFPSTYTDFTYMYLANDNKIYITSGNSVLDLHYINFPDSSGLACDVHLHDKHLPCFIERTIPNHPNYELGADSGSVCDTLQLAIKNLDFRKQKSIIQINPNPVVDYFYINYDLNVGDNALFILYDSYGNEVLKRNLYGSMKTLLVYCEQLSHGVYFYTSTVRNKIVDRGKVAVK